MKFLVIGGAGFIGSHIVEELVKKGEEVIVLDDLSAGKIENIQPFLNKIEFVQGDIRNLELLKKITKGVDFISHQAALRSVPKSVDNPSPYFEVNIQGHHNVLEAARINDIKGVTCASSSSVYGNTNIFPQKEHHKPDPESPYAITKLAGEGLCKFFYKNYGLNAISLRYFNVFGPRQDLENKYAVVVPAFITRIFNNQPPMIYGNGEQSRDFTFVKDVVNANLAALNSKNCGGEAFNVSEGKSMTINLLAQKINQILKKEIKPDYQNTRAGDVFKTLGCPEKSKEKLNFQCTHNFDDSLKETIRWFTNAN